MVAAVFSTRQFFIHLRIGSNYSLNFVEFLNDRRKYIKAEFKHKIISILLENTRTHWMKIWIETLKENFDRLIFIPPYTQQYAPVEHFYELFKNDLKVYNGDKIVSLWNGEYEKIIKQWISIVKSINIVRSFSHLIGITKKDIQAYLNSNEEWVIS